MPQDEIQVQSLITKNFSDNISYLQTLQPELFFKLTALENAMEKGHYQERYELIYENNYFDVLEKSTGNNLYSKSSKTHADLASQSIDYTLEGNLFEGFPELDISSDEYFSNEDKNSFEQHMNGFAPIVKYTKENSQKEKELKSIDKFVFFGIGLGLHITSIHKKINSKVYFIIEDDLELFRLSLFTTNYKQIAHDSVLFFSVFQNNYEFNDTAIKFLEYKYYYNHYIKYFHLLSHSENKLNQFHLTTTSQAHLLFFYNDLLTQYLKPLDYLFKDYKFLDKHIDFSDAILKNKPFLLVGAGPSLQKNISWLKQNHKKFVVVAVSATLSYLEKENIVPDIITHLDAFNVADAHFNKINSIVFFKDSVCFFSSRTKNEIISMFNDKQMFLFENSTQYINDSLKPSAPCVGSITYQILLYLKAKNIYLLGLDLAIDSKSGKTHSDTHEYGQTLATKENAFDNSSMVFKESLYTIEGNFSQNVLTTPNFQVSIDAIYYSTNVLKRDGQNVYNLSDGAKLRDTISMDVNDIKITTIDSEVRIKEDLYKLCEENSSIQLTDLDIKKIKDKLVHAKMMKDIVLNYIKTKDSDSTTPLIDLEEFCLILTQPRYIKDYELARVIDTYLKYILTYIFDFFNSNKLSEESLHFDYMNVLLTKHLLEIINYYHDILSSKIEENIYYKKQNKSEQL